MTYPDYAQTPLAARLLQPSFRARSFSVANFGDGPLLQYRGNACPISTMELRLIQSSGILELTHLSPPPYLLIVGRERDTLPLLTVLYQEDRYPVLEYDGSTDMTGQILAYGCEYGQGEVLAHAVYAAQKSQVYTACDRTCSLLLEGNAELCKHLLLCGKLMGWSLAKYANRETSPERIPIGGRYA